jgi:hypothetical protein
MAIDELIEVTGRAAIEAVLTLSAQEIAGPKHPGKKKRGHYLVWPAKYHHSFIQPKSESR